MSGRRRNVLLSAVLAAAGLVLVTAIWLAGCAPNEPFDPTSVPNHAPVVRMSVSPADGGDLSPTSYFDRHFSWYGSDDDGWVQEYYVSIRNDSTVAAPWDTTTNTDTTMTFFTNADGTAEATFYLVCRDDRGALSDTLVQYIPLRNFPPAINFQSDFNPLRNMQREVAGADTLYWNWGASNFRFFALDLDGAATMDAFYRYTVSPIEPTVTYDLGDPLADPLSTWVRVPFPTADEVREFEIFVSGVPAGAATLTVSVTDEAAADTRFSYSWDVRSPRSNILYVRDNTSSIGLNLYRALMDGRFGASNWDTYEFWMGFPDRPYVLLESMRQFEAVIWTGGDGTSDILRTASTRNGALENYVVPANGSAPGKLLMVSRVLTGSQTRLSSTFIQNIIGISPTGDPAPELNLIAGRQALGQVAGLPDIASITSSAKGIGLRTLAGTDVLYRMENCPRCYNRRPPYDPVMAVRRPDRATSPLASTVGFSMQLELFDNTAVIAALNAVLDTELGVSAP